MSAPTGGRVDGLKGGSAQGVGRRGADMTGTMIGCGVLDDSLDAGVGKR